MGTLTLVPTRKSTELFVATETYGIACRVLQADRDPAVSTIESEPEVPVPSAPSGKAHLDLRLTHSSGQRTFVEVRADEFVTDAGLQRLNEVQKTVTGWGDRFEFQRRDDAVNSTESEGLKFLFRFGNSSPSPEEVGIARSLLSSAVEMPLIEWMTTFRREGLAARVLYWAIAKQHLALAPRENLFPNGRLMSRG